MAWNGSDMKSAVRASTERRQNRSSSLWLYGIGIFVTIVGVIVVWLYTGNHASEPKVSHAVSAKPKKTQSENSTRKTKPQHVVIKEDKKPAKKEAEAKKEEWVMPSVLQTEEIEDGLIVCEVPSNMPSHARNPYKSQVESILSMLGKPGTPYTPVPIDPNMDMDADFLKALENTIVIWEDESEQSAQHKQLVNWMKQAVEEARKEGWKVGDLLRELEKERKHQWEMLSQAQTILSETEEMSPQHTATVRKSLNKELDQIGVDPIPQTETEDSVVQEELK
jgi:hypothetical protein